MLNPLGECTGWTLRRALCTTLLMAAGAVSSPGQGLSLDWSQIPVTPGVSAAGGGLALGAGDPRPGPAVSMGGGVFSLGGGFGSVVVPPPDDAPRLEIEISDDGTVRVSWPSAFPGYVLQVATRLAVPDWTASLDAVNDDGSVRFILLGPGPAARFYRLGTP